MSEGVYMAAHIIYEYTHHNKTLTMSRYLFSQKLFAHRDHYSVDLNRSIRPAANKRRRNGNKTDNFSNGTALGHKSRRMLKRLEELNIITRTDSTIVVKDLNLLIEKAEYQDCKCNSL